MYRFWTGILAVSCWASPGVGAERVDFVSQVKPVLEAACVHCHNPEKREGDFSMHSRESFFQGGETHGKEVIVKGYPDRSFVHSKTLLPSSDKKAMPPKDRLSQTQRELLGQWIEEGADWPNGVLLQERERVTQADVIRILVRGKPLTGSDRDRLREWVDQGAPWDFPISFEIESVEQFRKERSEITLVQSLWRIIDQKKMPRTEAEMKPYKSTIPKTGVDYEMLPIPGGRYRMGSPPGEPGHQENEGPQREMEIKPFWMGKYEITWEQFEPFMITAVPRHKDGSLEKIPEDAGLVDIVSSPTTPYTEMSFGMGKGKHPAINMTHHAANKFCQWLSAQTGNFYRLPTEAEWEYACRAGTTTAYSFGDDPGKLDEYAVYWKEDGIEKYEKVGTKKPNPWGLYDMHGNVLEWCLDQYFADAYLGERATIPAYRLYPRVSRGGSWYDDPENCRSASRFHSDKDWKAQDPELPKSRWYHTDALWQGFRIVRPLEQPSPREMYEAWNCGIADWEPWEE